MLLSHMKYVVVSTSRGNLPFVFHETIPHADMIKVLRAEWPSLTIVSAGFIKLRDGHAVQCYGDSVTLGVRADKNDSALITQLLDGELPER